METKVFEGVEFREDGLFFRFGKWKQGSNDGKGYLSIGINKKSFKVHRIIAQLFIPNDNPEYTQVHHINHDKSDNRVENLIWVSNQINCQDKTNTSRLGSGIYFDKRRNTFNVRFRINGIYKHFGVRKTLEEAQQCSKENNPINR